MLLGLRLRHDLLQPPALALGEGPRLLDADAVSHLRGVLLVVRVEAARALDRARVLRVLHAPLDLDDDRLLHLVGDPAGAPCGASPLGRRLVHLPASAFFSSARRYVLTRAISRRSTRRALGVSRGAADLSRRRL